MRGDAGACHVAAKILKMLKKISKLSRLVTTMRDIGCRAFRKQFVNCAWQMARRGANYASPCHLDSRRCRALREQNSCQREACLIHAPYEVALNLFRYVSLIARYHATRLADAFRWSTAIITSVWGIRSVQ